MEEEIDADTDVVTKDAEDAEDAESDDVVASKAELKNLLLQLSKKTTELKLSPKEVAIISKTLKGLMATADARDMAGKAQPFLNALGKLVG
jgi:hypothetical protein|tara:strand:- start:2241 stop:2513 length:273 start_codon:yes stop_codon:yes gene_type:complete